MSRQEFSTSTKQQALLRQKFKCGSCGEKITTLSQIGKQSHKQGEGAHGHHMRHDQQGGTNLLNNCVILCESCHYTVHNGGNYQNNQKFLIGKATDFPHFTG